MAFVYRITEHPEEDLKRNFSSVMGGWGFGDFCDTAFDTEEEAYEALAEYFQISVEEAQRRYEVGYHPKYGGFVEIHYHGLGAGALEAETLEEAIAEVQELGEAAYDLPCTMEAGDGSFCASRCKGFHKVDDDLYIFEV